MAASMSPDRTTHQIVVFGLSDRGLQRDNNEDHFMVADLTRKLVGVHENQLQPELFHHDIGAYGTLLMVADGLGGHEGGEIASQMAVDTIAQELVATADHGLPLAEQIVRAVAVAHQAICKFHGSSGRARHMASTLTAVHVGHGVVTIAQIGDSRAYRFSQGKLTLLTEDQTVVHMMQKKGMLTPEEAAVHPHRNIILQALGQDKTVLPEIQTLPYMDNDYLLLCSDGLSSYVAHERIEEIIASSPDEHWCCRHLVEEANAVGGADNVTVLLARLMIKQQLPPQTASASGRHPAPQSQPVVREQVRRPRSGAVSPPPHLIAAAPEPPTDTTLRQVRPGPVRAPRDTRSSEPPVARPTDEPAKPSIWKREIRWRWWQKDSKEPASFDPDAIGSEELALARSAEAEAASTLWEPQVLKIVEDTLATYLGPVAKILVERAAVQAKDLRDLCRMLAQQLATDQERTAFIRGVLLHNTIRSRRS